LWELRFRRDGWSVETGLVKGREPPDWYLEEPELLEGDELFLRAYWTLDSERSMGFSAGRIPWSKAIDYGVRLGLVPRMCDALWRIISTMDDGRIGFEMKQSEKQSSRARRRARAEARAGARKGKASTRRRSGKVRDYGR